MSELTKEDVWGKFDENFNLIDKGMIVARHEETCPVFNDEVPYKSVTVVCDIEQENDVTDWLSYVHGGDCVSMRKDLKDRKVALRSDYQCW